MKPNPVPLVICIDHDFIQPACAMLASVFYHSKAVYHIHIITNLEESELSEITGFIKRRGNLSTIYNIAEDQFKGLKLSDHISTATYFRFVIPEIIQEIDKGIYLDSDMIVLDDIENLFRTSLEGEIAGAVYPENEQGFNAGVLIIDFTRWRMEKISQKLFTWANQNIEKTIFWDQDALNAVLDKKMLKIDAKWNQTVALTGKGIIHFAGKHKPWSMHFVDTRKKYLYYKFLIRTPYIRYHVGDFLKIWIKFHLWG